MDARPLIAFVMEQHLGHGTYSENLRAALTRVDLGVETAWIPVEYGATRGWRERVPIRPVREALRGRHEVRHGLQAVDATACVFNTQVPAVLGGRAARRRPYILCTDVTPLQYDAMAAGYAHRADRRGLGRWLKRRVNRAIFQGAAAHAPWSDWVRSSLIEDYGVDPSRIEVIPPGVDTRTWPTANHHDGGPMRVLFVGGDFLRKGGQVLLDAIDALPAGTVELRIVTRSSVAAQPGLRTFTGLRHNDPKLKELFRTSDVMVLPSESETFGIAAVEGAAAGLPVVVSRVGALADLVVDGVTGFAITPGDRQALTAVLAELAARPDLRRDMGRAGRVRAEQQFDARINAARLIRLTLDALPDRSVLGSWSEPRSVN